MSVELTHTKLDFEKFPYMRPYIDTAHEIISSYSLADWVTEPQSKKYQYAHLWVCRRLYSFYNPTIEITNDLTRGLIKDSHLTAIAEVIHADEATFIKEYSKVLN